MPRAHESYTFKSFAGASGMFSGQFPTISGMACLEITPSPKRHTPPALESGNGIIQTIKSTNIAL
jgi:hypothetical protein